jgi:hypothetical protein
MKAVYHENQRGTVFVGKIQSFITLQQVALLQFTLTPLMVINMPDGTNTHKRR